MWRGSLPVDYRILSQGERRSVREEYARLQNGKCQYCNAPLDDAAPKRIRDKDINWRRLPPNFLRYPIHLHHDHKTGLTIGAVHNYCNAVLWQYHGE